MVVPKQDEWEATQTVFEIDFHRPDYELPNGATVYKHTYGACEIAFLFLNQQNTTNAAVATTRVLLREMPDFAFLVGTALGRPGSAPIASVLISSSVFDIVQRRIEPDADGRTTATYVPYTIQPRRQALAMAARSFASKEGRRKQVDARLRRLERMGKWFAESDVSMTNFLQEFRPILASEELASGNDYFMADPDQLLWSHFPTPKLYDMESAGFARAANEVDIDWLVVRGISDYGTKLSKDPARRNLSAAAAASFVREFVDSEQFPEPEVASAVNHGYEGQPALSLDSSVFATFDGAVPDMGAELFEATHRVGFIGRTGVNFLTEFKNQIVDLLSSGGRLELVVLDPECGAASSVYGNSTRSYTRNLHTIQPLLTELSEIDIGSVSIHLIDEVPAYSMVFSDRSGHDEAQLWLQLNLLRTRVGRDRPVIKISQEDPWYERLVHEFEVLRNSAQEWSAYDFIEKGTGLRLS